MMRVEDVRAEGAVFGIRDAGGLWSFYLQKKARITFTRLRKIKKTFGSSQYKDIEIVTGRTKPVLDKGKPTGKHIPEVILDKRTVNVTISVVKFFPGGGNAGAGGVALPPAQVKAILDSHNV
jgi:hypothetical protein